MQKLISLFANFVDIAYPISTMALASQGVSRLLAVPKEAEFVEINGGSNLERHCFQAFLDCPLSLKCFIILR